MSSPELNLADNIVSSMTPIFQKMGKIDRPFSVRFKKAIARFIINHGDRLVTS